MTRVFLIFSLFLLLSIDALAENIAETRKLAAQGDPWYQTEIAMMYHRGKDVPRDYNQAAKWYRLAATQGNAKAQANLGVMYAEGQGMQQDYHIAAEWFLKAAEQGYTPAQHNLGLLYVRGQGVPQNFVEAYIWASLAANSGHKDAVKNRDISAAKLSSEELKSARRRESYLYFKIEQRKTVQ